MKRHVLPTSSRPLFALAALPLFAFAGCQTRHTIVVEQPKPLEVNINFTGRLDLVIHEARQDIEKITGEKANRVVRPEDIGLPPAVTSGSFAPHLNAPQHVAMLTLANFQTPEAQPLATEEELKKSMADRFAQVRALLDTQNAGESHNGLLAPRGELTADQQALLAAENKDRSELYEKEAGRRKITVPEVALSYYLARLGHAKKGDWYEKYNKDAKAWEWKKWGE